MKNKLKSVRKGKGISQSQLAEKIGTDQRIVSRWENGKQTPKPYQMQFIEDYFGVPKEEIFFESFNYKIKLKKLIKWLLT